MKTGARTAIALFGGAAVLALAVGCGGGGGKSASSTTPTTTPTSSSSVPSPSPTKGGCIGGLNSWLMLSPESSAADKKSKVAEPSWRSRRG